MEIKISFHEKVYDICIGYKTRWFEQPSFLTVTKEFYDDNQRLVYGLMVFSS